jgi:hypothetical protein
MKNPVSVLHPSVHPTTLTSILLSKTLPAAVAWAALFSFPIAAGNLDFNQDGVADFAIQEGDWDPRDFGNFTHWWDLVVCGTNRVHTNTSLAFGSTVGPDSAGAWSRSDPLTLYLYGNQKVGPGMSWPIYGGILYQRTNVYLGLRFAAADGVHYGWVHYRGPGGVTLVDSAYHPVPGQPILVGEKPAPQPGDPGVMLKPIVAGTTIDFVLETRIQTNQSAGVISRSVTLLPVNAYELLVEPGTLLRRSAQLPVSFAIRPLLEIPAYPVQPALWSGDTQGVTLLIEETELATQNHRIVGPLAQSVLITILFRRVSGSGVSAGWLTLNRSGNVVGRGYSAWGYPMLGEPPPPATGEEVHMTSRLDFDGDGVVDAALFFLRATWVIPTSGTPVVLRWDVLSPLGPNEILHGETNRLQVLDYGASIPVLPISSPRWQPNLAPLAYAFEQPGMGPPFPKGWLAEGEELQVFGLAQSSYGLFGERLPDASGPGRSEGYVGFRLRKPDGLHYAWVHLKRPQGGPVEIAGWSYQPRPDTELAAGKPAPVSLRAWRSGDQLALWGNLMSAAWKLQTSPTLEPGSWVDVPGVSGNSCALRLDGAKGFYRLRGEP